MRLALALATVLLGLAAAPASAVTIFINGDTLADRWQHWADDMVTPTPPGSVALIIDHDRVIDACGARAACTWAPAPPTIWISDKAGTSRSWYRETLYHELGHQYDYQRMTDRARDAFRALIRDHRPWRAAPNSPHEQFAAAYMLCAHDDGALRRRFWNQQGKRYNMTAGYGYEPTRRQLLAACRLIERVAL